MGTPDLDFWQSDAPHALSANAPLAHAPAGSILVQTSGSEGKPKWVVLTKRAFLVSAEAVNRHLEVTAQDRWLIALPTHHVGGFSIFARAQVSGSSVHRFDAKWNAQRFAEVCAGERVTLTSLVPTQVFDIVAARIESPTSLRAIVVGGGGLAKDIGQAARELGWPVLQSYGMTEAASQIATEPLIHLHSGFDPDALEVLPHWQLHTSEHDQLILRGDALAKSYLCQNDDGSWHEELIGDELITRDQVSLWSHGTRTFLRFIGRESQLLKIMGELVNLTTLQARLDALDATRTSVIVDVPDERRGSALVLVHEGTNGESLMHQFNAQVAPFERLIRAVRVDKIPRSALGKVLRTELLPACHR